MLRALGTAPLAGLLVVALSSCAPEPGPLPATPPVNDVVDEASPATAPESPEAAPAEEPKRPAAEEPQAPAPTDCGWDSPTLAADLGKVPTGQEGDLSDVLPGAWQHVAYDEGAGYTDDLTADIRYVFPSTTELIYCQDVPGITDQAENRASVQLDGLEIVLPAPASGYAVQAWSKDAMVWVNHRDGSLYLLQRR